MIIVAYFWGIFALPLLVAIVINFLFPVSSSAVAWAARGTVFVLGFFKPTAMVGREMPAGAIEPLHPHVDLWGFVQARREFEAKVRYSDAAIAHLARHRVEGVATESIASYLAGVYKEAGTKVDTEYARREARLAVLPGQVAEAIARAKAITGHYTH